MGSAIETGGSLSCPRCASRAIRITLPSSDGELAVTSCNGCGLRRWSHNGETVEQGDLLDTIRRGGPRRWARSSTEP
jgi:transcription elongation factor Elf1